MGLYVFLFAYIFPSRTGITGGTNLTTYILSGLIPWLTFSELMSRSCTAITSSASLVKQIVFPIIVLPLKTALAALIPQIISTVLLLCWIQFSGSGFSWTLLLFPVIFALQIIALIGISLVFGTLGVFFKDLKDIVLIFVTAGLFLAPILYIPEILSAFPPAAKLVLNLNQSAISSGVIKTFFFFQQISHPFSWFIAISFSSAIFFVGKKLFEAV